MNKSKISRKKWSKKSQVDRQLPERFVSCRSGRRTRRNSTSSSDYNRGSIVPDRRRVHHRRNSRSSSNSTRRRNDPTDCRSHGRRRRNSPVMRRVMHIEVIEPINRSSTRKDEDYDYQGRRFNNNISHHERNIRDEYYLKGEKILLTSVSIEGRTGGIEARTDGTSSRRRSNRSTFDWQSVLETIEVVISQILRSMGSL